MKRTLLCLAVLAAMAGAAQAQTSTANSGSNSGSASTSNSGANSSAIGNINASQSQSGSQSGATSGSQSGAMGNNVTLNQNVPDVQTVNNSTTVNGTTREIYDGTLRSISEGTSTQNVVTSGGTFNRTEVAYSGSQTIKNVPSIAMSGPASGPCTGMSGGIGLAGPGWGFGANGAAVEPSCVVRENVRVIGMAMQSLDGGANPQEKGELLVLMMDAVRGLGAMNKQIIDKEVKAK